MTVQTELQIPVFTPDTFRNTWTKYKKEMKKLVAGNDDVLELILNAWFASGHILLQSVPGLGKTIIGNSMCAGLKDGEWGFFPFTADLLPSDIKGSEVYNEAKRIMEVMHGAIHPKHNIFVADEINRTTPKTLSALLAIMEELLIVIGPHTFPMADPFLVIGTQNPIEQEGTYPMSEALLDRFAMMAELTYLSANDEVGLLNNKAIYQRESHKAAKIEQVLTPADVIGMRRFVLDVNCTDAMTRYIVNLMRATRPGMDEFKKFMPGKLQEMVRLGGSQRTSKWVKICSQAAAAMRGSDNVEVQDVRKVFVPCLSHKLILRQDVKAKAKGENVAAQILQALLDNTDTFE